MGRILTEAACYLKWITEVSLWPSKWDTISSSHGSYLLQLQHCLNCCLSSSQQSPGQYLKCSVELLLSTDPEDDHYYTGRYLNTLSGLEWKGNIHLKHKIWIFGCELKQVDILVQEWMIWFITCVFISDVSIIDLFLFFCELHRNLIFLTVFF